MYPEMRRKDRLMQEDRARELLAGGEYGILSMVSGDGQPYGVPLSYVVLEGDIYFHCAMDGQKIRNLSHEARVSFCVVGETQPVFESNDFSTYYESVIVFGTAQMVEEESQKTVALMALCQKYLPEHMEHAGASIQHYGKRTGVWRIAVEHITGKAKPRPIGQSMD